MKAIRLHHVGGSESLLYDDAPNPIPKDNEVLVQVYATAITPTEFDWYPTFHTPEGTMRPFPIIPGHEFSGVVDAIGSDCKDMQVGASIYGLSDWFIDGAQAEYCVTVPANIAPKPVTLEHTQARSGANFSPDRLAGAYRPRPPLGRTTGADPWCSRWCLQLCRAGGPTSERPRNHHGFSGKQCLRQGARRR